MIILGESALSEEDRKFVIFAEEFENRFISQGEYENRAIEDTLALGWELCKIIPREELKRVSEKQIKKYMK